MNDFTAAQLAESARIVAEADAHVTFKSASWLVQYRGLNGAVMTTEHPSRDAARDVLTDSLMESAVRLWSLGLDTRHPSRAGLMDRGDLCLRHAARLLDTTEGEYVLALSGGRKWLLMEAPSGASE